MAGVPQSLEPPGLSFAALPATRSRELSEAPRGNLRRRASARVPQRARRVGRASSPPDGSTVRACTEWNGTADRTAPAGQARVRCRGGPADSRRRGAGARGLGGRAAAVVGAGRRPWSHSCDPQSGGSRRARVAGDAGHLPPAARAPMRTAGAVSGQADAALARAVGSVLQDPTAWRAAAAAAAVRVRAAYGDSVVCSQIEALYGELVAGT